MDILHHKFYLTALVFNCGFRKKSKITIMFFHAAAVVRMQSVRHFGQEMKSNVSQGSLSGFLKVLQ